jgi:hypothetical protein
MLRSVAFSSSSMNTPRFTPTATQRPVASPVAQTQRSGLQLFDQLKIFDRLRILPTELTIRSIYWGSFRTLRTELNNILDSHGSTPIALLSPEERMKHQTILQPLSKIKREILDLINTIPLELRSKSTQTIFAILNTMDF